MSLTVEPSQSGGARPARTTKHLLALIAVLLGAALFAAGLTATSGGVRHVIVDNGGFCASGGPYQISQANRCDDSVGGLMMGGIFGGLFGAAMLVLGSAAYRGFGAVGIGGVLWGALFGVLGFNFLQFGLDPPDGYSGGTPAYGWLIPGILFWVMALPGLLAPLLLLRWNRADRSDAAVAPAGPTIVRANVSPDVREQVPIIPGTRSLQPGAGPEPAAPPVLPWLIALGVGAAAGVLAGIQLVDSAF